MIGGLKKWIKSILKSLNPLNSLKPHYIQCERTKKWSVYGTSWKSVSALFILVTVVLSRNMSLTLFT